MTLLAVCGVVVRCKQREGGEHDDKGGSTNAKEDQKEEVEENAEGLGRELGAPVGGGEELDKVRLLPGQPGLARGLLAQQRHVVIRHPELVHRCLCLSPAALHLYDAGVRATQ